MKKKLISYVSKISGSTLVDGADLVRSCYAHLLQREPDDEGYGNYLGYLKNGGDVDLIVRDFADSDEFKRILVERSRSITPWIPIRDVVREVCRALLNLEPDAENEARYAEMLDEGTDVATVLRSFLISEECQRHICGRDHHGGDGLRVTFIQTCDGSKYYPLLQEGRKANEIFALRNKFKYECFIGIKRGYFPWHACFNRIVMLQDMIRAGYRGWVFYLDADAYIYDQSFNLTQYLERHSDKAFIAAVGGMTGHRWDINDGVFLINLGHPDAREIVHKWHDHFLGTPEDALRAAEHWEDVPSDQPRLHEILRNDPRLMDAMLVEDRGLFNEYKSTFVRQALRGRGLSIDERLEIMRLDLAANNVELIDCAVG